MVTVESQLALFIVGVCSFGGRLTEMKISFAFFALLLLAVETLAVTQSTEESSSAPSSSTHSTTTLANQSLTANTTTETTTTTTKIPSTSRPAPTSSQSTSSASSTELSSSDVSTTPQSTPPPSTNSTLETSTESSEAPFNSTQLLSHPADKPPTHPANSNQQTLPPKKIENHLAWAISMTALSVLLLGSSVTFGVLLFLCKRRQAQNAKTKPSRNAPTSKQKTKASGTVDEESSIMAQTVLVNNESVHSVKEMGGGVKRGEQSGDTPLKMKPPAPTKPSAQMKTAALSQPPPTMKTPAPTRPSAPMKTAAPTKPSEPMKTAIPDKPSAGMKTAAAETKRPSGDEKPPPPRGKSEGGTPHPDSRSQEKGGTESTARSNTHKRNTHKEPSSVVSVPLA